jgi:uncharacterized protein YqhQ
MRSRKTMVMCVRNPQKEIVTGVEQLNPIGDKYPALSVPFIRGIVNMVESMLMGFRSLMFSANNALEDDEPKKEQAKDKTGKEDESFSLGYGSLALIGVAVAGIMAVFFLVPYVLSSWIGLAPGSIVFNVTEAVIRLTMFVGYLAAIASWGEFRRVLQYHGAEHKAINAYEAGVSMDVEHVKTHSRLHPRCGTSFLFIVLIISIVLYTIMPNLGFLVNLSYRLLLIPVIAGISYELLRLSGKYRNSSISKALTSPGLAFQLLTTKEPTDDMLEVSIAAVKKVLELNPTMKTPAP